MGTEEAWTAASRATSTTCRLPGCRVEICVFIPSLQDLRSGQDLWFAELAAALAPFAEDTGSRGRLSRHEGFDKDYSNPAFCSTNPRFKEKGTCLYGDLCKFTHGKH